MISHDENVLRAALTDALRPLLECGRDKLPHYCPNHGGTLDLKRFVDVLVAALTGRPEAKVTIETGSDAVTFAPCDLRVGKAHDLCVELAEGTNGNVPIQSVYEAMLRLIGREDVVASMRLDGEP